MKTYNIYTNNGSSWGKDVIALFDTVFAVDHEAALRLHFERYGTKYSNSKIPAKFEDFAYSTDINELVTMTEPTAIQHLYSGNEDAFMHKDGQYIIVGQASMRDPMQWTDMEGNPAWPTVDGPDFTFPTDLQIFFDHEKCKEFPEGAWCVGQEECDKYYAVSLDGAMKLWKEAYPPTGEGMRNCDIDWKPYNDVISPKDRRAEKREPAPPKHFYAIAQNGGDWDSDSIGVVATILASSPREALEKYLERTEGGHYEYSEDVDLYFKLVDEWEYNQYFKGNPIEGFLYNTNDMIVACLVEDFVPVAQSASDEDDDLEPEGRYIIPRTSEPVIYRIYEDEGRSRLATEPPKDNFPMGYDLVRSEQDLKGEEHLLPEYRRLYRSLVNGDKSGQ
jgi:hypothetical protein